MDRFGRSITQLLSTRIHDGKLFFQNIECIFHRLHTTLCVPALIILAVFLIHVGIRKFKYVYQFIAKTKQFIFADLTALNGCRTSPFLLNLTEFFTDMLVFVTASRPEGCSLKAVLRQQHTAVYGSILQKFTLFHDRLGLLRLNLLFGLCLTFLVILIRLIIVICVVVCVDVFYIVIGLFRMNICLIYLLMPILRVCRLSDGTVRIQIIVISFALRTVQHLLIVQNGWSLLFRELILMTLLRGLKNIVPYIIAEMFFVYLFRVLSRLDIVKDQVHIFNHSLMIRSADIEDSTQCIALLCFRPAFLCKLLMERRPVHVVNLLIRIDDPD